MLEPTVITEPPPRMREWIRITMYAALSVGAVAAIVSLGFDLILQHQHRSPPTYFEYYKWQFAAWAMWIFLAAPSVATFRWAMQVGLDHWKAWAVFPVVGMLALTLHALWIGIVAAAASPFAGLSTFERAVNFHVPFGLPINLAILGLLAVIATRPSSAEVLGQKRAAERALRESERRFRDFFEQAVFGMFRSTPEGRFLMVNQAAATAIGYQSVDEALKGVTDINDIYADPRDRARYLDAIRREGRVTNWIWKMRRLDGATVWNSETSRGVFDNEGRLRYMEGTMKDITAEVVAREALQESERRSAELSMQLADAQLRALKLQIKPHFLFNILNTVAMMIRLGETDKAQHVVHKLGSMFRRFLEFEGEDMVTLEQEIGFIELYLELEQFRFEDRIELVRDVAPETLGVPVPTLILQPLVENAVKHGLAHMSNVCHLSLSAKLIDRSLKIEIGNDVNPDAIERSPPGFGIGLRNTRARLEELYGEAASLELHTTANRVLAVVIIPLEEVIS